MTTAVIKTNETFARSVKARMPGHDMPPPGAWKMELRRRPDAEPVALTFSSALGNLRVIAFDEDLKEVVLALLAPVQLFTGLAGSYHADLIYLDGDGAQNLGSFTFGVRTGVTQFPLPEPPPYDDLAAWEPIVDITGEDAATVLEMLERGLPGPPGPPGPAGATFEHVQASAAATWTINHNLSFRPAIALRTVGGVEFEGQITHISDNQAVVSLATPVAGFARCN